MEHATAMEELGRPSGASDPMFPTSTGGRLNPSNIRTRLLTRAVEKATAARGDEAMSFPKISPHSLRRIYASLALAAVQDPRFVMAQLGHTDARLTLSVYAQIVQRRSEDRALIWELMRFAGEPKSPPASRSFDPLNDTLAQNGSNTTSESAAASVTQTAA
jgi:integrase